MNYLPDKFEVEYVFFGLGGSNNLCLNGDKLDFEYKPERYSKNEPRKLEISPLKDEWLRFWIKMDEIGAWEWHEKYVPPKNILADGDMTDIKISYNGRQIKSFCWCNGPFNLRMFYEAVKELTDLDINFPRGVGIDLTRKKLLK